MLLFRHRTEQVIKSPDVLSVIRDVPHLKELVFSLYKCQYRQFFEALGIACASLPPHTHTHTVLPTPLIGCICLRFMFVAAITPTIKRDRFMAPHFNYYLRELRIVAYTQVCSRSLHCAFV